MVGICIALGSRGPPFLSRSRSVRQPDHCNQRSSLTRSIRTKEEDVMPIVDNAEEEGPEDMRIAVMVEVLAHSVAIRTLLAPLMILEEQRVRQQRIRDARKRNAAEAVTPAA